MFLCIMLFLNRTNELTRLDRLARGSEGGLAVVFGRRRVGKTRLLLEWTRRHHGLYFVADQSSASLQRRYLAQALATQLPGFGDVEYPDWRALFARLASEARLRKFRGPIVLDELPFGLFMEIEGSVMSIREAEMLLDIEELEVEHDTYPRMASRLGNAVGNLIESRF